MKNNSSSITTLEARPPTYRRDYYAEDHPDENFQIVNSGIRNTAKVLAILSTVALIMAQSVGTAIALVVAALLIGFLITFANQ